MSRKPWKLCIWKCNGTELIYIAMKWTRGTTAASGGVVVAIGNAPQTNHERNWRLSKRIERERSERRWQMNRNCVGHWIGSTKGEISLDIWRNFTSFPTTLLIESLLNASVHVPSDELWSIFMRPLQLLNFSASISTSVYATVINLLL